jgi:uncharacterized protein
MTSKRVSVFPLPGALLFPGLQLPLHIFEERYRALVSDALARDRMIGMIQPRENELKHGAPRGYRGPQLFDVGCLGRIADVEAMDDGRFNVILEGVSLFRVNRELDVTTQFRQFDVALIAPPQDDLLASIERAALENEAKRFAVWLGYRVDWDGVTQLDDVTLVNAIAQIAPFDVAAKQALLEAETVSARSELLVQLMRFASSRRDPDDNKATLQ